MEKEICKAALETWGEDAQVKMLFEEMAELQKAVCKVSRAHDREERVEILHNIAEEIADVRIMLAQMVILFDVEDATDTIREEKLTRLEGRIREAREREAATAEE